MIRVSRQSRRYFDKLRQYNIVLDGINIGYLRDGEIFEYRPTVGFHNIRITVDWCGSNTLCFEVHDNEIIEFECGGLLGYKMFLVYWYITFGFNKYLWIKQTRVRQSL